MSVVKFIINNIEREKEIIEIVYKNIEFLKAQKIKFTLPKNSVDREYNIKEYQDYKNQLKNRWEKEKGNFVERLLTFFHKTKKTQFKVEISKYGPLGFYNSSDNTIIINLNAKRNPTDIIKHEMVHIMVEPFIKKYKISYKNKEIIVDTILTVLSTK